MLRIYRGDQRTPEWYKSRKHRLTASNVAAACGRSIYKTIDALGDELVLSKKVEINANMQRGITYEPLIRDYYKDINKVDVEELGFAYRTDNYHLGVSPDGLVGDTGLIEIKCAARMYKEILSEKIEYSSTNQPLYIKNEHYDQMQTQMAVLGRLWCDYIVYAPVDNSIFIERVTFNELHWQMLKPKIDAFISTYLKDLETYNY